MKAFFKCKMGYTLVEVLVSLTILSLIAIPMFSFFIQAYDYTTRNQNNTVSVNVGRGVIEFMSKQNFQEMKNLLYAEGAEKDLFIGTTVDSYKFSETSIPDNEKIEINSNRYAVKVTMKKNAESYLDNYTLPITVTISWGHSSGNEITTTLEGAIVNETIR